MPRKCEKIYPYFLGILFTVLYHLYIPNEIKNILETNAPNLATAIISLSGIFLSFVGAILGVLASIKTTDIGNILKEQNAFKVLVRYIKECCVVSFLAFLIGVYFLMVYSAFQSITWIEIDIILLIFFIMTFSAFRIILILFAFVAVEPVSNLKNNLWNEKDYCPQKV